MTEQALTLTLIRVWVEGNQKALEWSVGERTFQILGITGAEGCYERFFFQGSEHPRRRRVSDGEVIDALQGATSSLELYRGEKGSGEFFDNADAALIAAKAWLGEK